MNDYSGEVFLNKIYQNLYLSDEVMHTALPSDTRNARIRKYMDRLERVHDKANNFHKLQLLKEYYYKKYVIKEENIPDTLDKKSIINAQKESLDKWLIFLTSDGARYPMWAKYWAFQGMLKIGTYDEENDTYDRRSSKTLAPFIEMNPEVLSRCIDLVKKYIGHEKIENVEFEQLLVNGSFQKLYTIFVNKYKEYVREKSGTEGVWVKFHEESLDMATAKEANGKEPEYLKLYNSLQGYSTRWCTAGSKDTAKDQICGISFYEGGDFYVYYTKDENGEYKIPRVAIRMIGRAEVAEVCGTDNSRNLEDGFEDIVAAKLKSIKEIKEDDLNDYLQILSDLKEISRLYQKVNSGEALSISEQAFIFELDHEIVNFGYEDNPKLERVRNKTIITDRSLLKEVVLHNGIFFKYADSKYKNDEEIILTAIKNDVEALKYADKNLTKDINFMMKAVQVCGSAIYFADGELYKNKTLTTLAVKQDGLALQLVHQNYRKDMDVVLMAVKQNGNALEFANPILQKDEEIVMTAVSQNGNALYYADPSLIDDEEIVLKAVREDGLALYFAGDKARSNPKIVLAAIQNNSEAIRYASPDLQEKFSELLNLEKNDENIKGKSL